MNDYASKGLGNLLKSFAGLLTAVVGFVTCLVTLVKLLQGNTGVVNGALLCFGIVIMWASLFCVYFLRKGKARQSAGITAVHESNEYFYSDRSRTLALVGIIAIPIFSFASFDAWGFYKLLQPKKVVVLVANFQSLDQQNYGVTETIIEQLRDATRKYPDVQIRALDEVITVQQGSESARSKGRAHEANIVIWGWYRKTLEKVFITVHYEPLKKPRCLSLHNEQKELDLPATELESFKVQTQLSDEMTYLTLLTIGLTRFEKRDYDGAIARLTDAISLQHVTPGKMVEPTDAYYYRGSAYLLKEDYDRAIADFDQVTKLSPNNSCAYMNIAYAYHLKNDFDSSIATINSILRLNPDNDLAFYHRGLNSYYKRNYDDAVNDLTQSIKLNPNLASAYMFRGAATYVKGEPDRALTDLNHALRLDAKDAYSYYIRGRVYLTKGDHDRAIAEYDKAIELTPNYAQAYYYRALTHFIKGNYKHTVSDVDQVIKFEPGLLDAYRIRGWSYIYTNSGDLAAADAVTYLKLKGWHGEQSLHMALMGHIGYRLARRNTNALNILEESMTQGETSVWPYPIIRYLRHEITADDLIELATDNDRMTEVRSHIGTDLLLAGSRDEALLHLRWVQNNGNKTFIEYPLALTGIRRIEAGKAVSIYSAF